MSMEGLFMRDRIPWSQRLRLVPTVTLLVLAGCGHPAFPQKLFTIEAPDADYPVMLSKARAGSAGRRIRTESRIHATASKEYVSDGNTRVATVRLTAFQSDMPAAAKFVAQVKRAEKWVQIEHVEFRAEDIAVYGAASSDRRFSIEGSAH
jgi:hypothetical protein